MALKFQSKMRLVYIVLGIMSSFILGYLYYSTSMDKIYRHEMSSLTVSVEQLKNQYDEMIETMKDVSYYLLSDPDILDAITSISLASYPASRRTILPLCGSDTISLNNP